MTFPDSSLKIKETFERIIPQKIQIDVPKVTTQVLLPEENAEKGKERLREASGGIFGEV
jgi:hypothetical protein